METVSIKKILEEKVVEASAPCRIDSGGTWDIKALALPFHALQPTTVNFALNLRTTVSLSPYKDGGVKVSSEGYEGGESSSLEAVPLISPFALFFACAAFFGFHGVHIRIRSSFPVQSGLGGSSTALVALIEAMGKVSQTLGRQKPSPSELLHLAYHLEDGVSGGNCGIQDQAAAVFGGVNQWIWSFEKKDTSALRRPLFVGKARTELSGRLLVAYSGKSHSSLEINRRWIQDFLSGKTRTGWMEANERVHQFAGALAKRAWGPAVGFLREETAIRREITPEAFIPVTEELVQQAEALGCGARFTGAGAGGSVWALGEREKMKRLREVWESALSEVPGGRILDCEVDEDGVN